MLSRLLVDAVSGHHVSVRQGDSTPGHEAKVDSRFLGNHVLEQKLARMTHAATSKHMHRYLANAAQGTSACALAGTFSESSRAPQSPFRQAGKFRFQGTRSPPTADNCSKRCNVLQIQTVHPTEQAQAQTGPTSDQSQSSAGIYFPAANFTVETAKPLSRSSDACGDAPDQRTDGANDLGEVSLL